MAKPKNDRSGYRVLVLDDDPGIIEDYRAVLCRPDDHSEPPVQADLETEIRGLVGPPEGYPDIELVACATADELEAAIGAGLADYAPFSVAFIEPALQSGILRPAAFAKLRRLDPEIYIVIVTGGDDTDPFELALQVPPPDRLQYLRKPFHGNEIRQIALALCARRRGERVPPEATSTEPGEAAGEAASWELWNLLPAGLLLLDRHDRVVRANDRLLALLPELEPCCVPGVAYEEVQGVLAGLHQPGADPFDEDAWLGQRLAWHAKSGGLSQLALAPRRWLFWLEASGPLGETYCLVNDISELKRRDQEAARERRFDQIAAALTALCGWLTGVSPDADIDEIAAALAVEDAAGSEGRDELRQRLQHMLDELRVIGRTQKLSPVPLHLGDEVETWLRLREARDDADRIEAVSSAGLWSVSLDREAFRDIAEELIDNADDAGVGAAKLSLETRNLRVTDEFAAGRKGLSPGDYVCLTIRDFGSGIPLDFQDQAIEPFQRLVKEPGHLGLGLSKAHGFVSQSGGYLELADDREEGFAVRLYFPRYRPTPTTDEIAGGSDP